MRDSESDAYGESNSYIHADSNSNVYSDSDCDGHCDGHGDSNSNCDRITAAYTDAATSADTAASPLALFGIKGTRETNLASSPFLHRIPSARTTGGFSDDYGLRPPDYVTGGKIIRKKY
jgi:hypothetical protein